MTRKNGPGYREISEHYEHLIRSGKLDPGMRLPTEAELAVQHSVTRTTIRRAFALLVGKGLVSKHQGRGTFVAGSDDVLQRSRSHVVIATRGSFAVDGQIDTENERRQWGYYEYIQATIATLAEHGRPFELFCFDDDTNGLNELRPSIAEKGHLGVITFDILSRRHMDAFRQLGVPVVFVDSATHELPINVVQAGNREGARQATLHLLRTTPGPVAYVGSFRSHERGNPHCERFQGYLDAHREMGRPVEDDLCAYCVVRSSEGAQAAEQVLNRETTPTGIFCSDDDIAHGVLHRLAARGLGVPADVSVIGFGGNSLCRFTVPPLSTVAMDLRLMGRYAVELIEELVANPQRAPRTIEVPTSLLIRQSTAPIDDLAAMSSTVADTGSDI